VPLLLPSFTARTANSGAIANWAKGFKAEGWYWGFAIGLAAFAITLKLSLFFGATAASIALFWVSSTLLSRN
jgi:hypothetical protein